MVLSTNAQSSLRSLTQDSPRTSSLLVPQQISLHLYHLDVVYVNSGTCTLTKYNGLIHGPLHVFQKGYKNDSYKILKHISMQECTYKCSAVPPAIVCDQELSTLCLRIRPKFFL